MVDIQARFDAPYWDLYQVLYWIVHREPAPNMDADDELPLVAELRPMIKEGGQETKSVPGAMQELTDSLGRASVQCFGRQHGFGDLKAIPACEWSHLQFSFAPVRAADNPPAAGSVWRDLTFSRDEILSEPDRKIN